MKGRHALSVVVALLCAMTAAAGTLTVTVVGHGVAAGPVALRMSRARPGVAPVSIDGLTAAESGAAVFDLDDGEWCVALREPSLWYEDKCLAIAGSRDVSLEVWPRASVTGGIHSPGERKITSLSLEFEGRTSTSQTLSGTTDCTVTAERFDCGLPEGVFDVRLRAPGYIGVMFLEVKTTVAAPISIGNLELRRGQSIVGRVELPRGSTNEISRTRIVAEPTSVADGIAPAVRATTLMATSAAADRKGRFQLDGLTPGAYDLVAKHSDGLASERIEVPVRDGADAVLTRPLLLHRPRRLDIVISPPLSPDNQPWRVVLDRVIARGKVAGTSESAAAADGSWSHSPLVPGRYAVSVVAGSRNVAYREEVEIRDFDERRHIALLMRDVGGVVTLGSKPIAASLKFTAAGASITATSDDDGAFTVRLPQIDDPWAVAVDNDSLQIHGFVRRVAIPDSGRLRIVVPSSSLFGKIVDENEGPVPLALLTITPLDAGGHDAPAVQPSASEDGSFSVSGLQDGRYGISAETPDRITPVMVTEVRENVPAEPIRLVALRRRLLRGRVISDFGAVAGAKVLVRDSNSGSWAVKSATSGADGFFTIALPPAATDLDVMTAAPGFAFALDHVHYEKGLMNVRVHQRGGTLVVHAPPETAVLLQRGGAVMPMSLLALQWTVNELRHDDRSVAAEALMMEPGLYSVCAVRQRTTNPTGCASGFVDPSATLNLRLDGR